MEITDRERYKLQYFFKTCNELINGRFILSDLKISNLLKAIADSAVLYELFTKSLANFNFERELAAAKTSNRINGGYFKMPREEKKIIALVFCLLLEVDNKKMKLQEFITDNFYSGEGYNISYSNFSLVMLMPFKNSVLNLLKIKEDGSKVVRPGEEVKKNQITMESVLEDNKVNMENQIKARYNLSLINLKKSLNQLENSIMHSTRLKNDNKEELLIIANAINESIDKDDIKIILALSIAFEHSLGKDKTIKNYYEDFKEKLVFVLQQ